MESHERKKPQHRMKVLLIGPSGVGKTTCGRAACALLGLSFCDLDERLEAELGPLIPFLATGGWSQFMRASARAILYATESVIAVGAGTQHGDGAAQVLKLYPTICLYAPAAEVMWHKPVGIRLGLESFASQEYSPARMAIYKNATQTLDLTMTGQQQATDRLSDVLRLAFGPPE